MKKWQLVKQKRRKNRAHRVRKRCQGTELKPRLCVVKTNNHIQAQLINDEKGITLGSTSTFSKEFRNTEFNRRNKVSARKIGERIAEIAKEHNVQEVSFDRGCYKYHGVLAEVADAARGAGLKF